MKKSAVLFIFASFFFFFAINSVYAQRGSARAEVITVRLASPLPRNSEWGRALDRLAAEWGRVTNNAVNVVVSHDGREGNETRMLSSLSSDSIQAALFTSVGLSEICPPVMTLSVPFMIRNDRELDLVLGELKPELERRVNNDFVIIAWSKGGWVYIFSKENVLTPDDLRRQRLGSSPDLKEMNTAFVRMGFNVVEADMATLGIRLASNAIDTIYMIPAAIAPFQLHRNLGNMLDMPIAPVMGAIVMNRVTWNKLNSGQQQEILRVTQRIAAEFDASVPRTESSAISSMGRDGLRVNKPTQAQEALWRAELDRALPPLLGSLFDRDIYQRINTILERARSGR